MNEKNRADTGTLEMLLEMLPVGVAIAHDRSCEKFSLNTAARRLLGTNDSDVHALRIQQNGRVLKPDERPMRIAAMTGRAVRNVKIDVIREGAPVQHLDVSAAPILDDAGQITGCLGIFVDATPGNARAEQLRGLALALADAEARERKRLAQLLHDHFQQLLSAAKLKAGMARRIASDDKTRANAKQIESLLEEAISSSRSLTIELSPPVLYDAGLGAAVEALSRSLEKQHNLRITPQCDPHAEPESEQVRVLLFEAVRELLHNVITHAGAAAVTITIGLSSTGEILIVVSDDGKGFDPLPLSTDPPPAIKPFGLLEIRERLNWIGGDLQIKSEPGKGTQVFVSVPAALRQYTGAVAQGMPPSPQMHVQTPSSVNNRRRARILVADDHAMFREGLISLLSHEPSFEVVGEAADGQQAIDLSRSLKPDILLVDISMPKFNGIQVTSHLSKEMPSLHIVGLSMHERQDMAAAMRSAGAAAYLTKDVSSELLLGVLRTLMPAGPATATSTK